MHFKGLFIIFILFNYNIICAQVDEKVIIENVEEEEKNKDEVPFVIIDEAPIFPGCKGTNSEKKSCLNKSIQLHIAKNFRAKIATNLGLSPGRKTIYIQFRITKEGEIEIMGVRAPHKKLKKETIRVINKLPKMIPGRHRNIPVNVKYVLPISFNVE